MRHAERVCLRRPAEVIERARPVALAGCIQLEDGDHLPLFRLFQRVAIMKPPPPRGIAAEGLPFVLRVAASVIVVMGVCFFAYLYHEKVNTVNLAAINPEYAKQQAHYTSLIANQRTQLKVIAKSDPQLYREFSSEIAKMDSTYNKLNTDLATSPNQERVLRAMIRNLQIQTEVLNQQLNVIEQFNELKEEQKNGNKNI